MAKLQLQLDLNEVTDMEFRALCACSKARRANRAIAARAPLPRNRRDGELRASAAPGNVRRMPRRRGGGGAPGNDREPERA